MRGFQPRPSDKSDRSDRSDTAAVFLSVAREAWKVADEAALRAMKRFAAVPQSMKHTFGA